MAINSPLLDVSIDGATGVLFSVTGGEDLSMFEVQEAAKIITAAADQNAKIIFGAVIDPTMKKGELKVTVIATGFPKPDAPKHLEDHMQNHFTKKTDRREEQRDERGRIYNSLPQSDEEELAEEEENDTPVQTQPRPLERRHIPDEDDSDWGGSLPSFLRRSKLK
jgi:cell division protein FtsZ